MNTKQPYIRRVDTRRTVSRHGITMLELVIAGAMLAGVMTSISLVMRVTRQAWEINDSESAVLQQMHAVSRHFVRSGREASGVTDIAADGTAITLDHPDGSTTQWRWISSSQGMSNVVMVSSSTSGNAVLAQDIESIRFEGFEADGKTQVVDPENIRLVALTVSVDLPKMATQRRQVRSTVWIRSW